MRLVAEQVPPQAGAYDAATDALYDRIIADQRAPIRIA
jgi:hypothetical protein